MGTSQHDSKHGMERKMQQGNTRDEVLKYLEELSDEFDGVMMQSFTAQSISGRLNISRNLASQYLNEFVKELLAVKIISRPVYFAHKKTLEKKYHQKLNIAVFKTVSSLLDVLQNKKSVQLGFAKAVGFNASLSNCVEQCKAAMRYPPDGLPILFWGATGTGKKFFAQQMFEYALGNQCVPSESAFITVNCGDYAENEQRFWSRLSSKDQSDWIAQAAGGLLFFSQVHLLPLKVQAELFPRIDALKRKMQESAPQTPFCKLAFSTNVTPRDNLNRDFLRRIPILVSLPSLEERSVDESSELILAFLKEEAQKINLEISISQQAFNAFLHYQYPENLAQLRSMIQISCAKAYLHHSDDKKSLFVRLYHLPERLIEAYQPDGTDFDGDEQAIQLDSMSERIRDRSYEFFVSLLQSWQAYAERKLDFPKLMKIWSRSLYEYDEFLVFSCRYSNQRIQVVGQVVEHVLDSLSQRHKIQFPANCLFMITRMIYNAIQSESEILQWEQHSAKELEACQRLVEENRPEVCAIAMDVSRMLNRHLNVSLSSISLLMLEICIYSANPEILVNDTVGVIVAHGYATASSIAQTVNALLQAQLFTPFDMPLSSSTSEIVSCVKKYIQSQHFFRNLVIAVDMGSLEEIDAGLRDVKNLNFGIVNNVTTKLVLDIGAGIQAGGELESILQCACERTVFRYRTVYRYELADAVIFAGESSGSTAQRMRQLFKDSLPKKIDVDIITYDFLSLSKNREADEIFKKRNVLFISGMFNPGIKEVPFIPVENIISLMEEKDFRRIFSKYLNAGELEEFSQNLLKNFSLQNVVKHLTILDADRLLDFVEEAVNRLRSAMSRQFSAKTIVGLYIHISCLIERLVTKTPVEGYKDLDVFEAVHEDFIRSMQESFAPICAHYHVILPASEIGYIYDYIQDENTDLSFKDDEF